MKLTNGAFGFGVIDTTYREDRYSNSADHPNCIINISNNILEAGKTVKTPEKKIKEGDTVHMKIENGHI